MNPTPSTSLILAALQARECKPKTTPRGWEARCPAHHDRSPSLGILQGDNGGTILKCAAGCEPGEIVAALGLDNQMHRGTKGAVFMNDGQKAPNPPAMANGHKPRKTHATLEAAIDAAKYGQSKAHDLPKETLTLAGTWLYHNAEGREVAAVVRFNLPAEDDGSKLSKTFSTVHRVSGGWQVGDPTSWPLYRLADVLGVVQMGGRLWWHEGEKAADAWAARIGPSTTTAHGAQSPGMTDYALLAGIDEVIILPDQDKQATGKDGKLRFYPDGTPFFVGQDYAEEIARRVFAVAPLAKVRILALPGLPPKGDGVEYLESWGDAPDGAILAALEELIAATPPLTAPPLRHEKPSTPNPAAILPPAATPAEVIDAEPQQPHDTPLEAAKAGKPWILRDLGNAHRFVHMHAAKARYDVRRGIWRLWDGKHWAADENETGIYALAEQTVRSILEEAVKCPTAAIAEAIAKWASKSFDRAKIENMLALASKQAAIVPPQAAWDSQPFLFNCSNGTIDLKTASLTPHNPADLLSCLSPAAYDPDAESELFMRCLTEWQHDIGTIEFLQRAAGYSLTGDTGEEKLFLLHGPAGSGKSSFTEMARAVMGDYGRTADFETFIKRSISTGGGARGDIARLAGSRFVSSIEVEEGKELAMALVKSVTGGDTISTRFMYKAEFEFKPQFKLWMVANDAPRIDADDTGMWRRLVCVPFTKAIPAEKRDSSVKARLVDVEETGAAYLAWAVRGCSLWQQDGLATPAALQVATSELKEEMDSTAEFFEECIDFNDHFQTAFVAIIQKYDVWCQTRCIPQGRRVGQRRMVNKLKARGCSAHMSNGQRFWKGLHPK